MPASLTDTRSSELYRRALELLPGGVNSPVRAMRAIGRDPIFIERGAGAEIVDVDGNRYVDYVCSWGPLIHGHAHPRVLAAVIAAAERGTSFGAPTAAEVDLAAEISRRMESVDMLRMTSSGTEATMTACDSPAPPPVASGSSSSPAPTTVTSTACSHRPARALPRTRCPPVPGVPAVRGRRDHDRAMERRRGAAGRHRERASRCAAIIVEPLPGEHGSGARPARASWSCCASAPTRPVRC